MAAPNANKGGGGKGGDQPRRNQQNKKKSNKLEKNARRNVNVSFQPGINSAYRGLDQANLDFQNQDLGVQSIYGGLDQEFPKLNEQYENRTADISGDLEGALSRFSAGLNQQGLPASEVAANTSVYGTQGNNFLNHLASNDQRALQWNQSAQREGGLSERYARQNLLQGLSDTQQQYYNRIADLNEQKQPAIMSELERLRQERQSNRQDKAYADMIASLTGNALSGGGGGGGTGGGGGGGDGRPRRNQGGGTVSWANIDNAPGMPNEGFASQDPYGPGWRGETLEDVRSSSYLNDPDMPGWVRYAFNRDGAQSLNDPRRRRLYRNKLEDIMNARFGAPEIEIPGGF